MEAARARVGVARARAEAAKVAQMAVDTRAAQAAAARARVGAARARVGAARVAQVVAEATAV